MQTRRLSRPPLEIVTDPVESAKAVGLRYVSDQSPGIRRTRRGRSFAYWDENGKQIRDPDILGRIKSLVIPPAWTKVWICPIAHGHLQATGCDVRGRKQYRYHSRWREVRDETKFNRMVEFAKVLPKIRKQVQRDLKRPGLCKEKVLATVVRLLEVSLIRIGNEEYVRENHSFGLTTFHNKHVKVSGSTLTFHFRGKAGKEHCVQIDDPRLARIVKRCQDLPGQDLFQYLDEKGERQPIGSADVNEYLKSITGQDFTAKDFRTWAGTVLAAKALQELETVDSQARAKKNIVRAVEAVAQMLGNTPSICRKCYVHPAVLDSYLDGTLVQVLRDRADAKIATSLGKLRPEEAAVLALLERRLRAEGQGVNGFKIRPLNGTLRTASRKTTLKAFAGRLRDRAKLPAPWRS